MMRLLDQRLRTGRIRIALYVLLLSVLLGSLYQGVIGLGAS